MEDHGSRPAQVKSSGDHVSTYSWEEWHVPVIPSYTGGRDWEIQGAFKKKVCKLPSQCKQARHDGVCLSSQRWQEA
jgi:hypothetical protein